MSSTYRTAAQWGLYIGLANLIWLYAARYLGLHTSGIMVFQVFMLVWFALTLAGYIAMLRRIKRGNPALSYGQGSSAGVVAGAVSAVVAVIAQVGYYKVVHPEWPEVMAGQTKDFFTAAGKTPAEIEQAVALARESFTLSNYAISSAVTALVMGIVLSAIIMIFLRSRRPA